MKINYSNGNILWQKNLPIPLTLNSIIPFDSRIILIGTITNDQNYLRSIFYQFELNNNNNIINDNGSILFGFNDLRPANAMLKSFPGVVGRMN